MTETGKALKARLLNERNAKVAQNRKQINAVEKGAKTAREQLIEASEKDGKPALPSKEEENVIEET